MKDTDDGVLEPSELDWSEKEETVQLDSSRYVISTGDNNPSIDGGDEQSTSTDASNSQKFTLSIQQGDSSSTDLSTEVNSAEELVAAVCKWYIQNYDPSEAIKRQMSFLVNQLK